MILKLTQQLVIASVGLFALPVAAQVVFDREGAIVERASPPGGDAAPSIAQVVLPDPRWGGCVLNVMGDPKVELRQSVVGDRVIDPCGYQVRADGAVRPDHAGKGSVHERASTPLPTIDRMTKREWHGYYANDMSARGQVLF